MEPESRNYLLKHVIEGRIEVTGRRGRRCNQQRDDHKEMRGYWKLKQEALDRNLWATGFGRGYGPIVTQNVENEPIIMISWLSNYATNSVILLLFRLRNLTKQAVTTQ
jgi:hypothetical protein